MPGVRRIGTWSADRLSRRRSGGRGAGSPERPPGMTSRGQLAALLVLAAVALALLTGGVFLYAWLLPHSAGAPEGTGSLVVTSGILCAALIAGAVWLLRSGRGD